MALDSHRIATNLLIRQNYIQKLSKRSNLKNPEFRGAALEIQTLTDKYVVVSGSARSGKSLAILWKINQLALQYPGARILIIRKTRESLNESALVTLERDVLGESNPIIPRGMRNARHTYRYPNGSEIIVAGLLASGKDQRARIMSTEYDLIYIQEATEFLEEEWGKLTTRLSNFRMPFQQIIGDCNPDAPGHWIWRYKLGQRVTFLTSFLKDNPKWWIINHKEVEAGHWTPEGKSVYETLSNLTGIDRERLFEGKWVQAVGIIYGDVWDDTGKDGNVTMDADYIPSGGEVLWGVDDGYVGEYDPLIQNFTSQSHPRVFLLFQRRKNGQICLFDESYKIGMMPDRHIGEVLALPYPKPYYADVDNSAAELRARLHHLNIPTMPGPHTVEESIKNMRSWIAPDTNGVRKFLVHPRCKFFLSEMASYKYDHDGKIIKEYDHGPDAARYLLHSIRYEK